MTMARRIPDTKIDFDSASHTYRVDNVRLPSVTQIMTPMSLMLYRDVPADTLQIAADRGTRVHEQVSNYVNYGLIETDIDTEGYIDAFIRFQNDVHPSEWVASEYRTYHRTMMYAGMLDLIGYITDDTGEGIDIVDIKTTRVYHSVMLATQLGGYAEALKSHGMQIRKRYGLQLMSDGSYRFETVGDGYKTFLHCMAIYNAMAKGTK